MRWLDRLFGLPPDPDVEGIIDAAIEKHVTATVDKTVRAVGELIYSQSITDQELGLVVGHLKEDHPELAAKVQHLREAIQRMNDVEIISKT